MMTPRETDKPGRSSCSRFTLVHTPRKREVAFVRKILKNAFSGFLVLYLYPSRQSIFQAATMITITSRTRKRVVSARSNCPNPLFEQWLEDWRKEAADRNLDLQYCYGRVTRYEIQVELSVVLELISYYFLLRRYSPCGGILLNFIVEKNVKS